MTSRIDIIGQNGNDGVHYFFDEAAEDIIKIVEDVLGFLDLTSNEHTELKKQIITYLSKD